MRQLLTLTLTVLLVGACAGNDASTDSNAGSGDPGSNGAMTAPERMVGGALTAAVLPFDAPRATFSTSQRGVVYVSYEPVEGGTTMRISGDGLDTRLLDWRRDGDSIYCSDGPDRVVEFMRLGAMPGATWMSSGRTLRFDGWERVQTPSGSYDAVRISSTLAVEPYVEVETWWFAPDIGLVQMRVDKGDLYSIEMQLVP